MNVDIVMFNPSCYRLEQTQTDMQTGPSAAVALIEVNTPAQSNKAIAWLQPRNTAVMSRISFPVQYQYITVGCVLMPTVTHGQTRFIILTTSSPLLGFVVASSP